MTINTAEIEARLAEIEARHAASEPGIWEHWGDISDKVMVKGTSCCICDIRGWGYYTGGSSLNLPADEAIKRQFANKDFIANAHQDVPYLLDLLSAETARADRMQADRDRSAADWSAILAGLPDDVVKDERFWKNYSNSPDRAILWAYNDLQSQLTAANEKMGTMRTLYPLVRQLIDGFASDPSVWSTWDEEVRIKLIAFGLELHTGDGNGR
jgi:hypothetical protein